MPVDDEEVALAEARKVMEEANKMQKAIKSAQQVARRKPTPVHAADKVADQNAAANVADWNAAANVADHDVAACNAAGCNKTACENSPEYELPTGGCSPKEADE